MYTLNIPGVYGDYFSRDLIEMLFLDEDLSGETQYLITANLNGVKIVLVDKSLLEDVLNGGSIIYIDGKDIHLLKNKIYCIRDYNISKKNLSIYYPFDFEVTGSKFDDIKIGNKELTERDKKTLIDYGADF